MVRKNAFSTLREATERGPRAGWTLLEVSLSLTILSFLTVAVVGVSSETAHAVAQSNSATTVGVDGRRVFARVAEILRKSLRGSRHGVAYPRVGANGEVLELLLPSADGLDSFDPVRGVVSADDAIFRIRLEPDGVLALSRDREIVWILGAGVRRTRFAASKESRESFEITLDLEGHDAPTIRGLVSLRQPRSGWRR